MVRARGGGRAAAGGCRSSRTGKAPGRGKAGTMADTRTLIEHLEDYRRHLLAGGPNTPTRTVGLTGCHDTRGQRFSAVSRWLARKGPEMKKTPENRGFLADYGPAPGGGPMNSPPQARF